MILESFKKRCEVKFSAWQWKPAVSGMFFFFASLIALREREKGVMKCTTSAPSIASLMIFASGRAIETPFFFRYPFSGPRLSVGTI